MPGSNIFTSTVSTIQTCLYETLSAIPHALYFTFLVSMLQCSCRTLNLIAVVCKLHLCQVALFFFFCNQISETKINQHINFGLSTISQFPLSL